MDEFETYEDVIDAYNANNMGYSTLTDYIKGENIKIKEISMEPLADLQRSLFENKADGGMIGIEVLFREKNKKGGRVGYAQGGSRRSKYDSTGGGLASSLKSKNISPGPGGGGGDNKPVKIIPPFKLPEGGPVIVDSVSEMLTKETLPAGALEKFYKMNAMLTDPTTGKSIKHLKVETPTDYTFRRVTPDGITENDIPQRFGAPQSLSVDPYSNNIIGSDLRADLTKAQKKALGKQKMGYDMGLFTIDDVRENIKPLGDPDKPATNEEIKEFFQAKDGGRVGLFMGGPALEGQALAIYNSMNVMGATDQEIADRLQSLGLYTTPGSGPGSGTTPTPTEGIIGIDIQERGGGFNPFGPLQSTFTKDLTDVDMYKGVNVEGLTPFQQMQKFKTATQDNMFGLGKFLQPKIRGTLGDRLANQPKLPLPGSIAAYARSPFNEDSPTYNPDLINQLNFLELGDNMIGMSNVGLKYGSGSVLAGKNVISGFGSNNYLTALNKFIKNTKNKQRKEQGERERDAFLAAEKARKEREAREQLEIQRAARREADRRAGAFDDKVRLDPGGGGTFKQQTAAKESQGVQVAGPGFGKGAYFADGGLATMFIRRR